jgi:tricorn protease-like protein
MSLIDEHEEVLATSLEDTDLFGVPIVFTSNDELTTFTLDGQVNRISRHMGVDLGYDITTKRQNISVRMSSLRSQLTFTDIEDLRVKLANYKITTSPQPSKVPDKDFLIEPGSIFPDAHLGIITIFLQELESIT